MAKSGLGEIITLAGLGVGGYFLYNWWMSQKAGPVTITNVTSGAPPPAASTIQVSQQLQTAAQSNPIFQAQGGQGDAYQWATLYNGLQGTVNATGVSVMPPSISAVNINSTFFPSGLPANASSLANTPGNSQQGLPLITAAQFVAGLTGAGVKGISGFGQASGARVISVPVMLSPTYRTRLPLPGNTTPAELQRRLRSVRR